MIKKIYTLDVSYFWRLFIAFIFSVLCTIVSAQDIRSRRPARHQPDTSQRVIAASDSADTAASFSHNPKVISRNAITDIVQYSARDSVVNDLQNRFTYLFGDAVVKYEDMELRAEYIEIDFKNNELYASGVADSNGRLYGTPVFIQSDATYTAREIKYNFTTKKGKISHVITTQDDGFIHGEQVKKMGDNVASTPPASWGTRISKSPSPRPKSSSTTKSSSVRPT